MFRLTLAWMRECLPLGWMLACVGATFGAAALSFDRALGSHSLGTYLAYVSLLPVVLLFRCGWLLQKRAQEGWPHEEMLRDVSSRKAPIAEFLACTCLLGLTLALALIPAATGLFPQPEPSSGLYPVHAQVNPEHQWLLDLGGPVPETAQLVLTLDWSQVTNPTQAVRVFAPDKRQVEAVPGKLLRWQLSKQEARFGKLALQASQGSNLALRKSLCRLAVPRPTAAALPKLLLNQFLFFLPLFAIVIACFRFGRIRGSLSAWVSFTVGSLVAMPVQPVDLGPGSIAALAKMLLLLKLSLPPVSGLLATGQRFERLIGTTATFSIAAWLMLGALALWLACRRRPLKVG